MASTLTQNIGRALQGFGAGVAGQGGQFTQGLNRQRLIEEKQIRQARGQDLIKIRGALARGDTAGAAEISQSRIDALQGSGRDATNSLRMQEAILMSQTPDQLTNVIGQLDDDLQSLVATGDLDAGALGIGGQTGLGAEQRAFEANIANLPQEQQDRARLIKLRLEPGAVGSAIQTITDTGIAEDIGDTEATIAQRKKFGELTGSSRANTIDKGFDTITKIDKNIRNMGRAITAIDEGASTGVIESRFFPSFKKATLQLEALQKELALDVIGSVTFGALSQGELDLAQEVALPTNLEPADLKQHLVDRIAAQGKLRGYYQDQIDFLDQGGTVAGFVRSRRRDEGGAAQQGGTQEAAQVAEGATATNPQTGETIVFRGGQWQAQ